MTDSVDQFIALEKSIADTVQQAQQKLRINARTQELLHVNGSASKLSPEETREQATLDVMGTPQFQKAPATNRQQPADQTKKSRNSFRLRSLCCRHG